MHCRVHVFDHPCFAVSGDDGKFEIKDVPPGRYELVFVDETAKAANEPVEVTVGARESKGVGEIAIGN